MSDKQVQKAGDNSQQLQAEKVYIINGITEERVRAICSEVAVKAIADNSNESNELAMKRIDCFTELMLPRIQSIEKTFESFAHPAFQVLLRKAQLTAACTERESDYKVLTELLVHRIKNKDNIKKKASISKAVEIIDQIDDDSLCALTLLHAITYFAPLSGNITEGINALTNLYCNLNYGDLPTDKLWLDNLSILGCMTVTPFLVLSPFEDRLFNSLNSAVIPF